VVVSAATMPTRSDRRFMEIDPFVRTQPSLQPGAEQTSHCAIGKALIYVNRRDLTAARIGGKFGSICSNRLRRVEGRLTHSRGRRTAA
jgi:hypothetical protein